MGGVATLARSMDCGLLAWGAGYYFLRGMDIVRGLFPFTLRILKAAAHSVAYSVTSSMERGEACNSWRPLERT